MRSFSPTVVEMSQNGGSTMTRAVWWTCLYAALAIATPTITFPINSQVPPVARVSQPFTFTFSSSTFSSPSNLTYTLSNAPSWLSLDGSTRTLSGVAPQSEANTAPTIQITASDSTGAVTMNSTLVVSGEPAPAVVVPLEAQLETFGEYSPPSSVLYYPSTQFKFSFSPGTFGQKSLNYYAVTLENTPLPAWLIFDGASLTFSGQTPNSSALVQPPQTFELQLIASEVLGFAGTAIKFNIVVGQHKLEFKDGIVSVNATVGTALTFSGLEGTLQLDGKTASISDITKIDAPTPSWLTFNNATFSLSGTPPSGATSFNVSITVVDIHGDIANAIVHININKSIFAGTIGSLNATIGMPFSRDLSPSFLNSSDVIVTTEIPSQAAWLRFDNTSLTLTGDVPSDIQPSQVNITIQASSRTTNETDSQSLTLDVIAAAAQSSSSSTSPTPISTDTAVATAAVISTDNSQPSSKKKLSGGEIAAIVVPLVLVIGAALLVCFCCYRRRRALAKRRAETPDKSEISNPILTSSQAEEQMTNGGRGRGTSYTGTSVSSRHAAGLKRHSQAMSAIGGGVSMHLRDSRSSGTRGRSYSENALSEFGSSWRYTQDGAYPPLPLSVGQSAVVRNTRNFSRKASVPFSQAETSSGDLLKSVGSKDISKASETSIQQTPDFAYTSENLRRERSRRRRTPNYLGGIPDLGRRLSGLGHGTIIGGAGGFGTGLSSPTRVSHDPRLSRDEDSWLTIPGSGSGDLKDDHRYSTLSALTESTEMLYSPKKTTVRQVPKSPIMPPAARLSFRSEFSRATSRRIVGASPFFAGSSRTGSRGTSRKSMKSLRDRYLYSGSPLSKSREASNNRLHMAIKQGLRDVEPVSLETGPVQGADPSADPLGISYGSPREGTRQLTRYLSQLSSRVSLSIRNSLQFSDNDSRFRSAEDSPNSPSQRQEGEEAWDYGYGYSPRMDDSPSSFNKDRYGIDDSPQLSEAIGAQTIMRPSLLPPLVTRTALQRAQFPSGEEQERYMPSPGRPASSYEHVLVPKKSFIASHYDGSSDHGGEAGIDHKDHSAFL
jgi:axial budding pattern protein 2